MPDKIRKLLIVIHGVGVNYPVFTHYVKEYQKLVQPDFTFAPQFLQENNGSFEEQYATYIFNPLTKILFYEEVGENPIETFIIGLSNGGKFAFRLTYDLLLEEKIKSIKLFTISSPLKGTNIVEQLPKILLYKQMGKTLTEELRPNSPLVHEMKEVHRSLAKNHKVKIYSIAGKNDIIVSPPENAYFKDDIHVILSGYDHTGMFVNSETLNFIKEHVHPYHPIGMEGKRTRSPKRKTTKSKRKSL